MIIILTPSIITFIYNIYVKILTLIQTDRHTDIQTGSLVEILRI